MAESERLELPETVKDVGIAIGSVLIVFLLTFAYSGNWPPMVVIESGSMEHDNNPLYSEPRYSHIGTRQITKNMEIMVMLLFITKMELRLTMVNQLLL